MQHRTRLFGGIFAVILGLSLAATASAYQGTVPGSVTISVKGGGVCGTPITVTATVLDAEGKPVAGKSVDWKLVLTLSPGDKINKSPTVTNSKGVATTTVILACVEGSRHVRATVGEVAGEAVLGVTVRGLPNTSTLQHESVRLSNSTLALLFLAAAGCAVGGLLLRRIVPARP